MENVQIFARYVKDTSGACEERRGLFRVELGEESQKYLMSCGMEMMAKQLIKEAAFKYRNDYECDVLTEDETEKLFERILTDWPIKPRTADDVRTFDNLIVWNDLVCEVAEVYDAILDERQHYYRVEFVVSQTVEAWIKASDADSASDLARDMCARDLDNLLLISAADMDCEVVNIYEDDEGYDGSDLLE